MSQTRNIVAAPAAFLLALGGLASLALCGCQVSVGGQTLPSPYYQYDDVQYYAPGPEFKLSREAAAMEQFNANRRLEQRRNTEPSGTSDAPVAPGP